MKLADARQVVIHRDNGLCVFCGLQYQEVHHRYRRGMGGSRDPEINSPVNLLCLCMVHHREAESRRTEVAEPYGLCVPNLPGAFLTPVRAWFGWALPTTGGTWLRIAPGYAFASWEGAQSSARLYGLLPA